MRILLCLVIIYRLNPEYVATGCAESRNELSQVCEKVLLRCFEDMEMAFWNKELIMQVNYDECSTSHSHLTHLNTQCIVIFGMMEEVS